MAISDLRSRLQTPGLMGLPATPLPGVATVFDVKHTISADLERQVLLEMEKAPPGATTLAFNIHTRTGINLAIVNRSTGGHVSTALWIGKSGWDQPIKEGWAGGVSLRGAW